MITYIIIRRRRIRSQLRNCQASRSSNSIRPLQRSEAQTSSSGAAGSAASAASAAAPGAGPGGRRLHAGNRHLRNCGLSVAISDGFSVACSNGISHFSGIVQRICHLSSGFLLELSHGFSVAFFQWMFMFVRSAVYFFPLRSVPRRRGAARRVAALRPARPLPPGAAAAAAALLNKNN